MLKYKDQYRVEFEKDIYGKQCEFNFIACSGKKGTQIFRYSESKLGAYITSVKIGLRMLREYPALFKLETETSLEIVLLFDEVDFPRAAAILKARKKVKQILTEEQREILRERMYALRKNPDKSAT